MADSNVSLLVLIGSRARGAGDVHAADSHSDWDFQIATSQRDSFARSDWLLRIGLKPLAYVERAGRLGTTRKATAVFADGEVDFVILDTATLLKMLVKITDRARKPSPSMELDAIHLASVLKGGYNIIKGAKEFATGYDFVATEIPADRLSDETVRARAEGFVCDYISTLRKIDRGELLAGRRWLNLQLLETNFQLLHELRLRSGLASLPDARRLELSGEPLADGLAVDMTLTAKSLYEATEKMADTLRTLARALVGQSWVWPDLSALHLRGK